MNKTIRRRESEAQQGLQDIHPILHRVYAARGISCKTELEKGLQHLLPFEQLKGIEAATLLLAEAIKAQRSILIVGDFDADGATSTALAVSALRAFGAQKVGFLVPNRFQFGYGLTPEIVAVAGESAKPDLIVTVDNGIASIAGVAAAQALGIQVLITDHHLPGNELPTAEAIVNPNQPGDIFPSKNLAGVGVIFYVMLALRTHLRQIDWFEQQNLPEPNMAAFLDLVALGTVADVVPLDRNNRILVHQGLGRICANKTRPGIAALLAVAGRHVSQLTASDLAFAVAPRLNAAGRLDDMSLGIHCLLSEDDNYARDLAVQLDALNRERQAIESDMQTQALEAVNQITLNDSLPLGLCLFDERWHQGVTGIVASRIKDKVHRPVIAFAAVSNEELKGSARSIAGVHIRDVLDAIATKHSDLIMKFGGHAMAAGLSLVRSKLADFRQAFITELSNHLTEAQLRQEILSDGELMLADMNLDVAKLLKNAGPWGQGFAEPLFDNRFKIVEQRLLKDRHLKLTLNLGDHLANIEAIAFNIDRTVWPNYRVTEAHAAYRLDINEYAGNQRLQLIIEHLEPVE